MDAGNELRTLFRPDVLALAAMATIDQDRENHAPIDRTAHVFRTVKNPEEVRTLRGVYGSGFFLIGIFADEKEREKYLTEDKGINGEEARKLIERDQGEDDKNGQQTRDTFLLADAFVRTKEDVWRVLDLLFGAPYESPSSDEFGMFFAYASSLRSVDLSRQVGAVIMSEQREVISTGCNDVPCPGGGLYWAGDEHDERDFQRKVDSNAKRRREIILDVMRRLQPKESENIADGALYTKAKELLGDSPLLDLTEYGRPVHAEMEALLSAARVGVSVRGATLFTTTYPCHNCAKHVVAAGIARVVYVEPYPKSMAKELHGDSIQFLSEGESKEKNRLHFEPFVGVGPRRYFDLFSLKLGSGYVVKRKKDGQALKWDQMRSGAAFRVPMQPLSYLDREALAVNELEKLENPS